MGHYSDQYASDTEKRNRQLVEEHVQYILHTLNKYIDGDKSYLQENQREAEKSRLSTAEQLAMVREPSRWFG